MLRDQSRADSTICQSEIPNDTLSLSFRNVFSSTPRSIPLQRETLLPLNLSIVDEEESPLDLSIHSIDKDLDAPLNLVVKPVTTNEASTRTSARSMFQTPLNLASGRKAVETFTGEQPKTHAEHHFQSEPESSNARRSMSESNLKLHDTVPLEVKTADLANHLSEGKPLLNVLGGDSSGSKAELPVIKRQCRETEQTGNNDYDEDSDDDGEGEAKLLNDFSIMEYFEPYRIEAVNFESDCEDAPECPTVDSDAENAVPRSIPGNDLGFKELNDSNIVKKRKCTASYNTVKNKVLKVRSILGPTEKSSCSKS
nr:uncharacterized protein LOC115262806 [Aedes albopictus]